MFEKFNEKARRALFFARYEASKLGSRVIESEHVLLGILREGEEIGHRALPALPRPAGRRSPRDRRRARFRRAHLLDRRAAALRGIEEDPRLRRARGRVDAAHRGGVRAPAGRDPARRRLRRDADPHPAELRRLHPARGGSVDRQGARGVAAEEGAAVPLRVQPRPHGARHPGELRPADRPRARGRAHRADPVAPHQEQPDPARRARRRQDGDRRGTGAAHRGGPGADLPRPEARARARPLAHRRRHQVPRPVRGATQGHPEGAQGLEGHHRLRRRDPLPHRRRVGRGLARRRQHPQAGAVARRGELHRRHDDQGVPQVHREGSFAPAPLPVGPGLAAEPGGDHADPGRGQGPLRVVPQGALLRRGAAAGDLPDLALHHRPLPARQGDRRHRRGGSQGQAAQGQGHAEPAPARAGDPAGGPRHEERDLGEELRARRLPARARDRAARGPRAHGRGGRRGCRARGDDPGYRRGHRGVDRDPRFEPAGGRGRAPPAHGGDAAQARRRAGDGDLRHLPRHPPLAPRGRQSAAADGVVHLPRSFGSGQDRSGAAARRVPLRHRSTRSCAST